MLESPTYLFRRFSILDIRVLLGLLPGDELSLSALFGRCANTRKLAVHQSLDEAVAAHVRRTSSRGEALRATTGRIETINERTVLLEHVTRNVRLYATLGMTNLARHLECVERALETGRQMGTVKAVLATLDALAVVIKCPSQLVGVDANSSRKLSLVSTFVYDTRFLECLELGALRSLLVSKAQVADVIGLSEDMRRELGIAAVFIHEAVALGVDGNATIVGKVLTQHRVVIGIMPSITLVRSHFLERST